MTEQERVVDLYSQGHYREADRLCIRLQHDGIDSPLMRAMRGFNSLHLGHAFRAIAWLAPVAEQLEPPYDGQAQINLCRAYGELNRFEEAAEAGRKAVQSAPDKPNAHINLAAALIFSGEFDEALNALIPLHESGQLKLAQGLLNWIAQSTELARSCLVKWLKMRNLHQVAADVTQIAPDRNFPWQGPEPRNALNAFRNALKVFNGGDLVAARNGFLSALKLRPDYFNAKLALVQLSRMETDHRSALAELDVLEQEHPDLADSDKGNVLAERARNLSGLEENIPAAEYAEKAVGLMPEDAEIWNALGYYQMQCQKIDDAKASLKQALRQKAAHHLAMNNLASLYLDEGNDAAAECVYKEQLKRSPDSLQAVIGLAHIHQVRGDFSGVKAYLKKALQLDPTDPYVARLAADADSEAVDDKMLEKLSKAGDAIDPDAPCPQNKSRANTQLLFALADLYAKRDIYDRAEDYLFPGNRINTYLTPYKPGLHENMGNRLRRIFSKENVGKWYGENPISGADVSNKTPVFVLGMPRSGSTLLERVLSANSLVATGGEMKQLTSELETTDCWRFLKAPGEDWFRMTHDAFFQPDLDAAAARYRNALDRVDPDASFVIDKMPGNFWWIPFILKMFPDAKILHTCRDARSTCLSCFRQNFSEGQSFSFSPKDLNHYFSLYNQMMRHYHKCFPGRILDVRYENMVSNLKDEMARVLGYCGLNWESEMERFYEKKGLVKTASVRQVRRPIYTSSLAKWKKFPRFVDQLGELNEYEPVI